MQEPGYSIRNINVYEARALYKTRREVDIQDGKLIINTRQYNLLSVDLETLREEFLIGDRAFKLVAYPFCRGCVFFCRGTEIYKYDPVSLSSEFIIDLRAQGEIIYMCTDQMDLLYVFSSSTICCFVTCVNTARKKIIWEAGVPSVDTKRLSMHYNFKRKEFSACAGNMSFLFDPDGARIDTESWIARDLLHTQLSPCGGFYLNSSIAYDGHVEVSMKFGGYSMKFKDVSYGIKQYERSAISLDGAFVSLIYPKGVANIHDTFSGRLRLKINLGDDDLWWQIFSPCGRYLAFQTPRGVFVAKFDKPLPFILYSFRGFGTFCVLSDGSVMEERGNLESLPIDQSKASEALLAASYNSSLPEPARAKDRKTLLNRYRFDIFQTALRLHSRRRGRVWPKDVVQLIGNYTCKK